MILTNKLTIDYSKIPKSPVINFSSKFKRKCSIPLTPVHSFKLSMCELFLEDPQNLLFLNLKQKHYVSLDLIVNWVNCEIKALISFIQDYISWFANCKFFVRDDQNLLFLNLKKKPLCLLEFWCELCEQWTQAFDSYDSIWNFKMWKLITLCKRSSKISKIFLNSKQNKIVSFEFTVNWVNCELKPLYLWLQLTRLNHFSPKRGRALKG